jgi:Ca2+-binding RTX toxin-like protein
MSDTIFTAVDLGILSGTRTLSDFVGTGDNVDFYRFTLLQNSDLNLVFDSESTLTVSLIADLNNNGVVDSGETVTSGSTSGVTVSRFASLPTDTYIVRVERAFNNSANYDLTLIETPRPSTLATDPGNTIRDALNLGSIRGSIDLNDYVGTLDRLDFYQFTLDQNSDVSITVQGIPRSGTSLRTAFIADLNNNGVVDSGETITSISIGSSGRTVSTPLPAGTYLTVMETFFSNQSFQYEKTLTVTPNPSNLATDPGDTLRTALDLGVLSRDRLLRDYISDRFDSTDVYKFRLTQKSTLTANFFGSSPNNRGVQGALIADLNNNGIVDSGEIIAGAGGITTRFSETLNPGTYFFRISEFFEPTHYNLRLSQTPDLSGNDRLRGTNGRDVIRGFGGNDIILGLGGNDRLLGDAGNDRLDGGTGNDQLFGSTGRDQLIGGAGNDILNGGSDRDILIGGAGNDILDGGLGNDRITTGSGRDRIVLRRNSGFDTVTDFQNGQDKIDLVGIRFGQLTLERDRNDVLIKLGRSNLMRLENTNLAAINQADFV